METALPIILLTTLGFVSFCFYKVLTYGILMSKTSKKFRYHEYWTSGIRNHEDYNFSGSWFDKRSAKNIVGKSGIGWSRLVDSRTGEVILDTSPSSENLENVQVINRIVDDLRRDLRRGL